MAPSECNKTLRVPSVYSASISTNLTSSTSDLNSAIYSPRALYAQTFDRPYSSESAPAVGSAQRRNRKNIRDMTGSFDFLTTEDEFEQLPIAVRRKYFSTLERLRFAQNSRSSAINDLPMQKTRRSSLADRRGLNIPVIDSRKKQSESSRQRRLSRQPSVTSNEASWFWTLPEKVRKKQYTREEQVILAGRLRESVILDAADEAIYKASRRASRNLSTIPDHRQPSPSRDSMDSQTGSMTEEMFETFRWMDEESDLDLSLNLDDYHANLDGVVLPSPTNHRRPSFRRHMSISKIPFGRNSISSSNPRSPKLTQDSNGHSRSRTMSLMSSKHTVNKSITTIDPNATHYQDPEARLKLRVYLASPQKFDEAIEFGFPSMDGPAEGADKENKPPKRTSTDSAIKRSFATDKSKETFLNDDTASLFSDDISMADPDSPVTPLDPRHRASPSNGVHVSKGSGDFSHLGITKPTLVKQPGDSYTQAIAGNREMTLRMTLTRPDLRADESKIYGWQTAKNSLQEPLALEELEGKYDGRGPFGGADGWGPAEKDNGVVKRFWNRVKSQKKSS